VTECYDSWGNKNLVKEWDKNSSNFNQDVAELVMPVVEVCRKINTSKLSKAVIHGDMQRKHVLKNKRGEYCILDFGCMSFDAKVNDLSTYLAWFCLAPDTWDSWEEIWDKVVQEYQSIQHLNDYELSLLQILTRASYANYFLTTSLMMAGGDTTDETREWHDQAREMLHRTLVWG
jgi:Ser/Thr protein kinase RdoA (MazF antagonist)